MRSRFAALASASIATALACGNSAGFACEGHSECILAGVEGVCQSDGNCSYPDAACPSGFRYPAGASDDVAGDCVPGEIATTGTSGETTTTSSSMTSLGTLSQSGSATTLSTGTATTGTTLGMTATEESGTTGSTGCNPDPNEGQDPITIEPDGCMSVPDQPLAASLSDANDRDEYRLVYLQSCMNELIPAVQLNTEEEMRVCVFFSCPETGGNCLMGSSATSDDGDPGCCSTVEQNPGAQAAISCIDGYVATIYVDSGPDLCADYTLVYGDEVPPE